MEQITMFPGLGMQEALIILAILIVITFHILMITHVLFKKNASILYKGLWTLAIILVPIVGAAVYRIFAYHDRKKS